MWIGQSKRGRKGNHSANRVGNDAMREFPGRKRTAKKAGLFVGLCELLADDEVSRSPTARWPRSVGGCAVGLGIVAAMSVPAARGSPARSDPIPMSSARAAAKPREAESAGKEDEEAPEIYKCVIWHVGANLARKMVYFEEGSLL